jgi:hypothetical protein
MLAGIVEKGAEDPTLAAQAKNNSLESFASAHMLEFREKW